MLHNDEKFHGKTAGQTVADPGQRASTDNAPALDADAIMQQVHAEVARRRASGNGLSDPITAPASDANGADAHWRPAASRLPDKTQYTLNDFLAFDDADFVDVAYRRLLQRPANDQGSREYLAALRSGGIGKVDILGSIRFSGEGRQHGVHVDGLLLPYELHRWRRKRIIGWFVGMALAVLHLPRLAWRLQHIEASAARESQAVGRLLNQHLAGMQTQQARLHASLDQVHAEFSRLAAAQQTRHDEMDTLMAALETRLESQNAVLHGLQTGFEDQSALVAELRGVVADDLQPRLEAQSVSMTELRTVVTDEQRRLRSMLERLTVFLDVSAKQSSVEVSGATTQESETERQYAAFEDAFRGERNEIKLRVAHYIGTLQAAGIQPGDAGCVLDLGSGRGEWLEVLAEHGYRGRGVDLDRGMLAASRERGHEVVEANVIDYLRVQDDNVFAAITSMHLVEHIPHSALIELVDQALRVLRPGGVLILETPNPENVRVGSYTFYMDPTHRNPIPPLLLQWVVQARGFEQVAIERLSEHRGDPALLPVSHNVPGAKQINLMVDWFTTPPDYAVIARKPTAS